MKCYISTFLPQFKRWNTPLQLQAPKFYRHIPKFVRGDLSKHPLKRALPVSTMMGSKLVKDGWFKEESSLWPGQAMSLQVEEVLYDKRSKYQDILVFKSTNYGNVLVLDGVIQCTERDEFSYQEMMAHLPMFTHPNPESVVLIGGGDGGVAREVLKHPSVKRVVLCEIDEDVVTVARKYLPKMAVSFEDERLELFTGDGAQFLKEHKEEFDVVITDSSDPIGPASSLFEKAYYETLHQSLRPGGVICTQGECMWLHAKLIEPLLSFCKELFPVVEYAYVCIPTYPSGQIGFVLCGKDEHMNFRLPRRAPSREMQQDLQYYNTNIHQAAFVLPEFALRALYGRSSAE